MFFVYSMLGPVLENDVQTPPPTVKVAKQIVFAKDSQCSKTFTNIIRFLTFFLSTKFSFRNANQCYPMTSLFGDSIQKCSGPGCGGPGWVRGV